MADDAPTSDDERYVELTSISAIYPELLLDPDNPFSAAIDLPVCPSVPIPVVFPESTDGLSIAAIRLRDEPVPAANEVHLLSYLPSIHLHINLPEGYPADRSPVFELSVTPQWLSNKKLAELQADGGKLWEEFGHDQVVFAYIDHLQQAAETGFGALGEDGQLPLAQDVKISILDFDIKAKKAAFDKETFDCGICLDPKKGTVCHRMLDCGHVFCRNCLQDYYNKAIAEGDLVSVRCLTFGCVKEREKAAAEERRKRPKTSISPSELLQIPLDHEVVQRYVALKHKAELESDKNTIYCPRKWCQGAARSKKHRKPESLEDAESSDEEEDLDEDNKKGFVAGAELLAICEDCSFAFCRRCYQGWHGEFSSCIPRTNTGELTEEDKASMEYLKRHTTPCPTCAAPAQKTHGCNHMICFRCNTHFCYLCSAWLEPGNPYKHFNEPILPCYMRLWELEEGDGENPGGHRLDDEVDDEDVENPDPFDIAQDLDGRDEAALPGNHPNNQRDVEAVGAVEEAIAGGDLELQQVALPAAAPAPAAPQIERQAPLVLRIGALPPAAPPAPAAPVGVVPGRGGRGGRPQVRARGRGGRQMGYAGRRDAAVARRMADRLAAGQRGEEELNEADQIWVQRFVMAALNDEEDMIDDHDHDVWANAADRGMDRRR